MTNTNIRLEQERNAAACFRYGVSLHSHTLHSSESLDFIYRYAIKVAPMRAALQRGEAQYRAAHGCALDLTRAYWTPPLAPRDAWKLESEHIATLGLDSFVSITDHDNIDAPLTLRVLSECRDIPVSVEWTVPVGGTFVHLGVHNLPADSARQIMNELSFYTARGSEAKLGELLRWVSSNPETLVVFNHPCWDEKGIGHAEHRAAASDLLRNYGDCLHAVELNGLRPWKENREVIELAREFNKPAVSGGDRHGLEPNTLLNLTNAGSFEEFVEEIRGGWSDVLITEQYSEPLFLRILQNIEDILANHENHGKGWRRWDERVFYKCDDGVTRSLFQLWNGKGPLATRIFVGGIQMLRQPGIQHLFRATFARRQEVAL